MRSFEELDDIYNDLSWLEDHDIKDFKNQAKALDLQKEVTITFDKMNALSGSEAFGGPNAHLLLNNAVEFLEALNKLYRGVRFG